MSVTCVIQARMGSSRLPGKALMDLGGIPMLALMLARLRPLAADHVVVATSTARRDDAIAGLCNGLGVGVVRGSEHDVLERVQDASARHPADHVIRLTADCPLSDPSLINAVVATHIDRSAHYTSNTLLRTYPDGLDVEVMRSSVLARACATARDPLEREHVTPWIYRHPEWHNLTAHRGDRDVGDERWTVDTAPDLDRLRRIVASVADPVSATWEQFLGAHGRDADRSTGPRLRPACSGDERFLLLLRNDPDSVRHSATGRAVTSTEHQAWFDAHLDRPATRIWIGCLGTERVGQIRIDVRAGVGTLSYAVDAPHRRRGVGSALVAGLLDALRQDFQVTRLVAVVNKDNLASQRTFLANGFARQDDGSRHRYTWTRPE